MMLAGLLVSRLFLSIGMILFGINALWNISPKKWFRNTWWLLGAAWVAAYALSWFWSEQKDTWESLLQVKLPILLLPVAFAHVPQFSRKQLEILTVCTALMLLGGVAFSLWFLVKDYAHYVKEYQLSHLLPTLVYKDYISFSLTCSLFIMWCVCFFPRITTVRTRWFLGCAIIVIAVFIHILASKSGLIALYLFIISWSVYNVFTKKSIAGFAVLAATPVVLIAAISYIPTLHERKAHIIYSYYVFKANDRESAAHLGDLSRITSYQIALRLIKANPLIGVGTGDMLTEMDKGYAQWYPYITDETNKLIPHNQFLTVALGCGIPASVIFIMWVLTPLFWLKRNRESFFFFVAWLILFIQLMIEPFLEGQFGVFIYMFFLLLFSHSLKAGGKTTAAALP